jgi:RNA recognition motif-containing protein
MLDSQITDNKIQTTQITIYVGNITGATTEFELRQAFEPFGDVLAVTILNDDCASNNHPKYYAFVGMAGKTQGENAIANLNGKTMGSRVISVISALRLSPSRQTLATHHGRYGKKTKTPVTPIS